MKTKPLRSCVPHSVIIIAVLVLAAVTTRLLPLAISEYPFNNDGISDSRIASDILASGHLEYPEGSFYVESHSTITPAYNTLEAFVAAAVGLTPYEIAQFCVAMFSILTILGGYIVALTISGSRKGAIAAALFLTLFGTFVFLTGSSWKASLGVALLVLLVYAFMNRHLKRMLVLEISLLLMLVFVHHLVTFLAYLTIVYLTVWSLFATFRNARAIGRRHAIDLVTIAATAVAAYFYYSASSLDRLVYVSDLNGVFLMGLSFAAICLVSIFVLKSKKHLRFTIAPIPPLVIVALVIWDYYSPLFPYESGYPQYILILALAYSVLISFAWLGFEVAVRSRMMYRAIPLGALLPVLTLMLFATLSGFDLQSHQILYRSFDFGGIALALGIALSVKHFEGRKIRQMAAIIAIIVALLVSFPFAYASDTLLGIRHDTQEYEVDCIDWIYESIEYSLIVESDERFSYNARAFYDYEKKPFLPGKLDSHEPLRPGFLYVYSEDWSTNGVNDYPNGLRVLDATYVGSVLSDSNIVYVGGPCPSNIVAFSYSTVSAYAIWS